MKIYRLIIILVLPAFLMTCKDKYEAPTNEPSVIYVTTGYGTSNPLVQINGSESFADLSQGVVSRQWTFPGGDVTDVTTSAEKNVFSTWTKTGTYNVDLTINFQDNPWSWVDSAAIATKTVDTTFVVTVVDSVDAVLQAFYIKEDGSDSTELDLTSGALNKLMAGESVRFKQSSIGAPNTFEYIVEGASPSSEINNDPDAVVDIKYKRLGNYDLTFEASRPKPFGSDVIELTNYLEVIPSTKPVLIETISRYSPTSLYIAFTRSMADPSAEAGNFTVRAKNVVKDAIGLPVPFDQELPIISAELGDGEEDNYVIINLGDEIYNSDSIFVSYTPGSLMSADGVAVESFSEELLTWVIPNIAEQYGDMEDELDWFTGAILADAQTNIITPAEWTSERAYSGNMSVKMKSLGTIAQDKTWCEVIAKANYTDRADWEYDRDYRFTLKDEATYRVSYMLYIESFDPPTDGGWTEFSVYTWPKGGKINTWEIRDPSDPLAWNGKPDFKTGEWVHVQGKSTINLSGEGFVALYFRTIGAVTCYVDDFVVEEVEVRPHP